MKKIITLIVIGFVISTRAFAQGALPQSISVSPSDTTMSVGDSLLFTAGVTDSNLVIIDTSVVWSVTDTSIGSITSTGTFTAVSAGTTYAVASLGDLTDSATVIVTAQADTATTVTVVVIGSIEISPTEQSVSIGDSLQLSAEVKDTSSAEVDTSVTWSVLDSTVGTIDANGLFIAQSEGTTQVVASLGDITDSTSVTVAAADTTPAGDVNTIDFYRILANGNVTKHGNTVSEGDTKTLGGILNYLNGGKLTFPEGSLSENIKITIKCFYFTNRFRKIIIKFIIIIFFNYFRFW